MTVDEFRALALSLPRAIEKPHFDRASFRVDAPRGKTIATLLERDETANVFLNVEEQDLLIHADPTVFSKVPTKWGDKGATTIQLGAADRLQDVPRPALGREICPEAPAKAIGHTTSARIQSTRFTHMGDRREFSAHSPFTCLLFNLSD